MAKSLIEIGFDSETKSLVQELIDSRKAEQARIFAYDPNRGSVYCPVEEFTSRSLSVNGTIRQAYLDRDGNVSWIDPADIGQVAMARDGGWRRLFVETS